MKRFFGGDSPLLSGISTGRSTVTTCPSSQFKLSRKSRRLLPDPILMCGKKAMTSPPSYTLLPPIDCRSIRQEVSICNREKSFSTIPTLRPKRVRWDPQVHETVSKKPERVRSRQQFDTEEVIWWSHLDEFQFRKERDSAILNLLRENSQEPRCHLRQFSLRERRDAATEYIRRLLSNESEEDCSSVSRTSSFSTGSSDGEESSLAKRNLAKITAAQNQLQDAWENMFRLIRSRGRGLRRR